MQMSSNAAFRQLMDVTGSSRSDFIAVRSHELDCGHSKISGQNRSFFPAFPGTYRSVQLQLRLKGQPSGKDHVICLRILQSRMVSCSSQLAST